MAEPEAPPPPAFDPRERLRWAIESLRLPAGGDPRFASLDAIAANRDDFVVEVHTTWKRIQVEAITNIMGIETRLARADVLPIKKGVEPWLRYSCRLWRRVMDAVVWAMVGKPHMIRRLCANRPRPTLHESNPQAVGAILDQINDEPKSIAIWSDATTCVDVADIIARRDSPELEFIELKQGKVNKAIIDLHETLIVRRKAGDDAGATKALDEFFATYGAKGFKQAMRFTKQLMRDYRLMDVVNKETGTDPDVGMNVETVETSFGSETYDFELTACLREADAKGSAFRCIDGCLWVFVAPDPPLTRRDTVAEFSRRVFEVSPETKAWLVDRTGKDVLHPVGTVDQWSFVPSAIPIFLRPLAIEDIVDIVFPLGRLMGRVWLFFDWKRFEKVVLDAGCELRWMKPRQIDGRYVEPIIGKRTPRVVRSDVSGSMLGVSPMTKVMAEGIRPSSVAAEYADILTNLRKPDRGSTER
jgi:hypothetical protein